MSADSQFEGWLGLDADSVKGKMQWKKFEPKVWEEEDVDIKISHCGVCGSDLHVLSSGWGPSPYPCCVGHEIVGTAVRVGSKVTRIKVGDRVGVGAQAKSCMKPDCPNCSVGLENHCLNMVQTYASPYPDGKGMSYGGYSTHNRTHNRFVFKIPDGLDSADAAPMLCGGVTVYSPLRRNNCGPGKTVGIVGVGGLGHFGILFAKALGADKVVGISRKADKRADALKIGADDYIATDDDKDWATKHARSLDLIISTVSSAKMPFADYMSLLKTHGTIVQVGIPDGGALPNINAFGLVMAGASVQGSAIGSPKDIEDMLQLAVEKKVKPWIVQRPMKDANQVVVDMVDGKARYRYVLVN